MRFDISLMGSDHKDGYKYLCSIKPCLEDMGLQHSGEVALKDENEMREKLKGVLLITSIERAATALRNHELNQVEYHNISITETRAASLGWKWK
jgi:hypothetical protein